MSVKLPVTVVIEGEELRKMVAEFAANKLSLVGRISAKISYSVDDYDKLRFDVTFSPPESEIKHDL